MQQDDSHMFITKLIYFLAEFDRKYCFIILFIIFSGDTYIQNSKYLTLIIFQSNEKLVNRKCLARSTLNKKYIYI